MTTHIKKSAPVILFDNQPRLTHADRKRLGHHTASVNNLIAIMSSSLVPEDDIKRMVLMEFEGKMRPVVVERLLGYLHSSQRKRVFTALRHHAGA